MRPSKRATKKGVPGWLAVLVIVIVLAAAVFVYLRSKPRFEAAQTKEFKELQSTVQETMSRRGWGPNAQGRMGEQSGQPGRRGAGAGGAAGRGRGAGRSPGQGQ